MPIFLLLAEINILFFCSLKTIRIRYAFESLWQEYSINYSCVFCIVCCFIFSLKEENDLLLTLHLDLSH